MIIGLASPRVATSIDDGLEKINLMLSEASAKGAQIICFPEAYLPGLRGQDFEVCAFDEVQEQRLLKEISRMALLYKTAVIAGMEFLTESGRQIVAVVIDRNGTIQGYQTKNQLDPTEEPYYTPGLYRQMFQIDGVKFGISICHEGFRYPETVRWAATHGASIVFHPHMTGSDRSGVVLKDWGQPDAPYYEKAMMLRSMENTIYFASVNYAMRFQESATSLIHPSGRCQAFLPYAEEGILIQEINIADATGLLAKRYAPERF